ncbi:hypothetical protein [Methylomonas koyamae]|uniref:hypothetical protein n=1 Tax=Methylomonas koyamae TaxID=702114 RepID=UPI0009EEAC20|nr:hypothetical protein [Methylomonas koyamae]
MVEDSRSGCKPKDGGVAILRWKNGGQSVFGLDRSAQKSQGACGVGRYDQFIAIRLAGGRSIKRPSSPVRHPANQSKITLFFSEVRKRSDHGSKASTRASDALALSMMRVINRYPDLSHAVVKIKLAKKINDAFIAKFDFGFITAV